MRTTRILYVAAFAAALAPAAPAAGQHVCPDTEPVMRCYNRLVNAAREAGEAQAASTQDQAAGEENKDLQGKATGPNLSENLAQSAIRDFLPRFAGSFITSDPADDLRALDLRFNTPLADTAGPRLAFQGGITLHKAELYAPLVDSIPESMRDASKKRLGDGLEDGDDATVFAAFNLESHTIGRAFAYHQDVADRLANSIVARGEELVGGSPDELVAFENEFIPKLTIENLDPNRQNDPACITVTTAGRRARMGDALPASCLSTALRAELDSLLTPVARYEALRQIEIAQVLSRTGFDRISDLVNNQPQVNFTAEYRSRVGVVGPNEWTGRLRWERGFYNMNGLRNYCRAHRDTAAAPPPVVSGSTATASADTVVAEVAPAADPVTLTCLDEYTTDVATPARMARGDRLWIAAEARYRPEYDVSLPEDSVAFSLGTGVGFGISGGYGRYLGSVEEDEDDRDRIDLHVSYDFADGEDLRQSRFLAGVFYTLRINDNASGVVGLAWANKPEFVDGADRQLGANFGLSYKFNRGKEGEQD